MNLEEILTLIDKLSVRGDDSKTRFVDAEELKEEIKKL